MAALDQQAVRFGPGVEARLGIDGVCARASQNVGGELCVEAEEVVAKRRARHRLPAVLAWQRRDPVAQPVQAQPAADEEVQARHLVDRALGGAGHADDVERGEGRSGSRRGARSSGTPRSVRLGRMRRQRIALLGVQHLRQCLADRRGAGGEALDLGADVEWPRPARAQRVARSTRRRASSSISICTVGVDLEVERLDVGPEPPHVEHVPRDGAGACDIGGARAGVLPQAEHEGRAGAVDYAVRHPRGDDLAPQSVLFEPVGEALGQRVREVVGQLAVSAGSSGRSESNSSAYSVILL